MCYPSILMSETSFLMFYTSLLMVDASRVIVYCRPPSVPVTVGLLVGCVKAVGDGKGFTVAPGALDYESRAGPAVIGPFGVGFDALWAFAVEDGKAFVTGLAAFEWFVAFRVQGRVQPVNLTTL